MSAACNHTTRGKSVRTARVSLQPWFCYLVAQFNLSTFQSFRRSVVQCPALRCHYSLRHHQLWSHIHTTGPVLPSHQTEGPASVASNSVRRCNRCEKPASKLDPLAFCRLLNVSSSRTPSSIPSPSTACSPPNRCSVRVSWTPSSPARVRPLCSALVRPAHMCTPTHRKNPRDPKSLKGFHETSALPVVCLNATRVLLPDPSTNHDLAHVYPSPEHHQFRCPVLRCPEARCSVFRREIPGEWSRVGFCAAQTRGGHGVRRRREAGSVSELHNHWEPINPWCRP